MHAIGHPIVGDPVYRDRGKGRGDPRLDAFPRQALHAARLAFVHPSSGDKVAFEAPLPQDMLALLDALA
jgi:23S rRNA pseudouridine1911/1915/1917 synthase